MGKHFLYPQKYALQYTYDMTTTQIPNYTACLQTLTNQNSVATLC